MRPLKPIKLLSCILLSAASVVGGARLYEHLKHRPNVVLIVVDGLRADAVSTSAGAARTPAVHALAQDGVEFRAAFAHAPSSAPALAALLTGLPPHESGVDVRGDLPEGTPRLAETLSELGYQTRAVVAHRGLEPKRRGHGLDRGFDAYEIDTSPLPTAASVQRRTLAALSSMEPERPFLLLAHFADPCAPFRAHGTVKHEVDVLFDGREPVPWNVAEAAALERELELRRGHHTVEVRSDEPFRLRSFRCALPTGELAYTVVEGGDGPTKRLLVDMQVEESGPVPARITLVLEDAPSVAEQRARHRLEVEAVDRAVAAIVDALRRQGIYDDTLVILTGGHGESLGEHGRIGHDDSVYDEVLRVPLVIKPPRDHRLRAELEVRKSLLVRHVDVAPTIHAFVGLTEPDAGVGTSLALDARRVLEAEAWPPLAPEPWFALRDLQYKLLWRPEQEAFEMFNLVQDPSELDNVFTTQGHLRAEWQFRLRALARGPSEG